MDKKAEGIKNILMEHWGRGNPVTSKEISREMGFPMEDTQAVSRKAIHQAAEEYGLPLISSNKGFFLAETEEELGAYNNTIENRIKGMEETRDRANENYRRWKK